MSKFMVDTAFVEGLFSAEDDARTISEIARQPRDLVASARELAGSVPELAAQLDRLQQQADRWAGRTAELSDLVALDVQQLRRIVDHVHAEGYAGVVTSSADDSALAKMMNGSTAVARWVANLGIAMATPMEQARWWRSLNPALQDQLTSYAPQLIGSLPGLPGVVRNRANRSRLADELARFRDELSSVESAMAEVQRRLDELFDPVGYLGDPLGTMSTPGELQAELARLKHERQVAEARVNSITSLTKMLGITDLDNDPHLPTDRYLLSLDTSKERVEAAVAVGNIDTAKHIGVYTPGMTSTVNGNMARYVGEMHDLRRVGEDLGVPQDQTAVVTWLGYQAPQDNASVIHADPARIGGRDLNRFLGGITANAGADLHLTAIGHSYVSTTTGYALRSGPHAVDDVVFAGSPGTSTSDVQDLNMGPGRVFVAENHDDIVADLGAFGRDPNQLEGVRHLSTAAYADQGVTLKESREHGSYFYEQTTSQWNTGAVLVDRKSRLVEQQMVDAGDQKRRLVETIGPIFWAADKWRENPPGPLAGEVQ